MHLIKKISFILGFFLACNVNVYSQKTKKAPEVNNAPASQWTKEKASAWYAAHKWIIGADYIPSNAINQLEMWQADTFDSSINDRELGYAENIGFNTMRVFLHSLAWREDKDGFKKRMNTFLNIAGKHHIQILFVFFDDCWNKKPYAGTQPAPKQGVHNSGWVQDPGQPASTDTSNFPELESYVKDILTTFAHDKRILLWDLYNEPGNSGKGDASLPLLSKVFQWARSANPDQPISAGLWEWDLERLNQFQVANSDIITYHNYEEATSHEKVIRILKSFGRPLICTEYMARPRNSRFSTILPILKNENVGAINWGFVTGKTNTKYAWDTPIPDGSEPAEWFHDIFHPDGTTYRADEVNLIKKLDGKIE